MEYRACIAKLTRKHISTLTRLRAEKKSAAGNRTVPDEYILKNEHLMDQIAERSKKRVIPDSLSCRRKWHSELLTMKEYSSNVYLPPDVTHPFLHTIVSKKIQKNAQYQPFWEVVIQNSIPTRRHGSRKTH